MPRNTPTALITGIAGFAGSWLAEELLCHGYRVFGAVLPGELTANLSGVRAGLELFRLDITHLGRCRQLVGRIRPTAIFHLAAYASVGGSVGLEREVFRVNWEGTLNLLEASRELPRLRRFLFVSSPDCYGLFSPKSRILTEDQPLAPVSPYGISKAAAEQTCLFYHRQHGLPVVVARAFNHTGPRQGEQFAVPSFARQIALIEARRARPVVFTGNLDARRDLSDVRDIVRGYRLVVEQGRVGSVYQLCTGRAVAMESVLRQLLKLTRLRVAVRAHSGLVRKIDIPVLRGSNRKAVQEIGYQVRYSLKTTLQDTLNYWRERVLSEST